MNPEKESRDVALDIMIKSCFFHYPFLDMIKRHIRSILPLWVVWMIFTACTPVKTSMDVPVGCISPESLWKAYLADHPSGFTWKTYARLDVQNGSERFPLRAALVIHPPSDIRIEILPVIGSPEFLMTVHEGRIKVFLHATGKFYTGSASEQNLRMFLPGTPPMKDAIPLLVGITPDLIGKAHFTCTSERLHYRIERFASQGEIQSLLIDSFTGNLLQLDLSNAQKTETWSVIYDEYRNIGGKVFPHRIVIKNGKGYCVTINYEDPSWTSLYEANLFDLEVPQGENSIDLDKTTRSEN
jgi:outer membrane biogenesis lipoprotein LolB